MGSPLVVGVDPSAKKIAVVGHSTLTNTSFARAFPLYAKGQTRQTPESMLRALEAMEGLIDSTSTMGSERLAYVETPLVGRGGTTATIKQAYIGGIIRAMLVRGGFQVYDVNVSTWKKDVVGKGSAEKPDVQRVVRIKWPKVEPLAGGDGDLWDAAGICLYGQEVQRRRAALPPAGGVR